MRPVSALLLCTLLACGDDDGPEPPAADLIDDVVALQRVIGDDIATGPLEEVDEMVSEDRPVAAADLLRTGAIPAARRHLDRVKAVEPGTAEGRRLHQALVEAYEARMSSLEQYATVLDRGMVEDLALVEALGAQRAATEAVIAVDDQLAEISPLPEARERTPEIRH